MCWSKERQLTGRSLETVSGGQSNPHAGPVVESTRPRYSQQEGRSDGQPVTVVAGGWWVVDLSSPYIWRSVIWAV